MRKKPTKKAKDSKLTWIAIAFGLGILLFQRELLTWYIIAVIGYIFLK